MLAGADLLINLSAVTVLRDEHLRVPLRVYLETDPVLPQIEVAQGNARTIELLDAHTHHLTYAENLGTPGCGVPVSRIGYLTTRPPVVLDWWGGRASTVAATTDLHDGGELAPARQGHDLPRAAV